MTIVIIAAILAIGAVAYTLLIRPADLPESEAASPTEHLEARKSRIHEGLRDLQFEYRVGKLSEEDYQKTKDELQRDLDRVNTKIAASTGKFAEGAAPALEKTAVTSQKKRAGTRCPHCGAKFEQALKFCGECGQPMKEETT